MKKNLNLQNVDLTTIRTGNPAVRRVIDLGYSIVNIAFTVPGAVIFVTGCLFALTLNGR